MLWIPIPPRPPLLGTKKQSYQGLFGIRKTQAPVAQKLKNGLTQNLIPIPIQTMAYPSPFYPSLPMVGWAIWYRNKAITISDEVIAQIRAAPTDTMGWFEEELAAAWKHIFPITTTSIKARNIPFRSSSMGENPKSVVEIPHGHSVNIRKGSLGVEQAKATISCAPLRQIGLACWREESDQFQGVDISTHGECTYVEVVPDSQPSQEVRSSSLLQRRDSGDIEQLGGVEAGLGGI